ncbi:MAG: DUF2884 family protein [Lysobacteraceae bacterium]|nr:MAG: DUF2884 family protein [Xanthomonadaceae bacterium]
MHCEWNNTMPRLAIVIALAASAPLARADVAALADTCGASSSYDIDVGTRVLRFDRADPAPRLVEIGERSLRVDGQAIASDAATRARLVEFEQAASALLPRVRRIASDGVDLAVSALRAEAASLGLGAATREEIASRLDRHAVALKRRIATSTGTHAWQAERLERELEGIVADVAPLAAADLGQQALAATLEGDFERSAELQQKAFGLVDELQPRLERRMQPLRARIEALCPELERLHRLQRDFRDAHGQPLHLLDIEAG